MRKSGRLLWMVLLLVMGVLAFVPLPLGYSPSGERVFSVYASQYAYNPAELEVNPGDRVTIELISTDVVHGLYIDGYGVSVTADPGQTARLEFVADREGSFRIRCNVTCGAMHPFMIGKLQVGHNTLLWRAIGLSSIAVFGVFLLFQTQRSYKDAKIGES